MTIFLNALILFAILTIVNGFTASVVALIGRIWRK